jgi:hypothetical protein
MKNSIDRKNPIQAVTGIMTSRVTMKMLNSGLGFFRVPCLTSGKRPFQGESLPLLPVQFSGAASIVIECHQGGIECSVP